MGAVNAKKDAVAVGKLPYFADRQLDAEYVGGVRAENQSGIHPQIPAELSESRLRVTFMHMGNAELHALFGKLHDRPCHGIVLHVRDDHVISR